MISFNYFFYFTLINFIVLLYIEKHLWNNFIGNDIEDFKVIMIL